MVREANVKAAMSEKALVESNMKVKLHDFKKGGGGCATF